MKTSVVLMVALWANTTLLLSESLEFLTSNINTWVLVFVELVLIAIYYFHKVSKAFDEVFDIEISASDVYLRENVKPQE